MGLFQQIRDMFSGEGTQHLQRWASGQASLADPNSAETQQAHSLLSSASPEQLKEAVAEAARQGDPQDYSEHLSSGGANAFSNLDSNSLRTFAGALMNRIKGSPESGSAMSGLANLIPGFQNKEPGEMNHSEVASMANYVRQNHPEIFGQAVSDAGQKQPGLLHMLLGHKLLTAAVAALAIRYLRH